MKKIFLAIFFVVILCGFSTTTEENLEGTWNYECKEAPYEYQKGKLIFSKGDEGLKASIKLSSGGQLDVEEFTLEDNKFSMIFYIDYEKITFNGTFKNDQLEGKVSSPEGILTVTAQKVKE